MNRDIQYFTGLQRAVGPPAVFGHRPFEGREYRQAIPEGAVPITMDPLPLLARGFMPPLLTLSGQEAATRWWEGYIATYLERDLRQISQIESLPDFDRLMRALALRNGQMLNQTEVARDIGLSQPSVHRYLNILEATYLLERLPAFARNRTKRLMKSPKIYWVDPGLAAHLCGHFDAESLAASREVGGLFESLILLHLKALAQMLVPRPRFSYWRTITGKEVDLVVEHGRKLLAVEIKLTTAPRYQDAENLRVFLEEYPETEAALLVHSGAEVKRLHEKILAVPWVLLSRQSS